jgi:hypothetical protein
MSDPIVISDSIYATMVYYSDKGIIHHTFHQHMEGEPFRAFLNAGTDAMKQHGATKWLSDDRKNTLVTPEDFKWANEDWVARTLKAGWKYWAIIVPNEVEGRISMKGAIDSFFEMGLRINLFSSVEKAMEWLESAK